jgi:bacterioferritin
MCANWGYERIAHKVYEESIDEMKHANELVERILFLEGMPNLQKLGRVRVGTSVPEQFNLDRALEVEAVARLNAAIATCVAEDDNTSRDLLEEMLKSEEDHLDWLEKQLSLIRLGKTYLAEHSEVGASGSRWSRPAASALGGCTPRRVPASSAVPAVGRVPAGALSIPRRARHEHARRRRARGAPRIVLPRRDHGSATTIAGRPTSSRGGPRSDRTVGFGDV